MGEPIPLLLVEDDDGTREGYSEALRRAGFEVTEAASAADAVQALNERAFPVAVVDIYLPDGRGLSLLRRLQQRDPQCVVIVVTGFASLDTALAALREGAYEYLCKPFSGDELVRAVRRGLERRELIAANLRMAAQLAEVAGQSAPAAGEAEKQVAAFSELADTVSKTRNSSAALAAICKTAADLTRADLTAVLVPEDDAALVVACSSPGNVKAGSRLKLSSLLAEACQGRTVAAPDILFDEGLHDDFLAGLGYSSALVVPVMLHGNCLGVLLSAWRAAEGFVEETASLLSVVAAQTAPVLQQWLDEREGQGGDEFVDIERLL